MYLARRSRVGKISGRLPAILPFFRILGVNFVFLTLNSLSSRDRAPTLLKLEFIGKLRNT